MYDITERMWNLGQVKAGFTRNFSYARKRSGCGKSSACPFTLHAKETYYSWMMIAVVKHMASLKLWAIVKATLWHITQSILWHIKKAICEWMLRKNWILLSVWTFPPVLKRKLNQTKHYLNNISGLRVR